MFKKAIPLAAPFKATMYGPPGSGKSLTALMFAEGLAKVRGKRIAYIDTEFSSRPYRQPVPARRVHPEAFDFDVLDTRSLFEGLRAIQGINPDTHGVIVLDTISRMWDAAREAYSAKNPGADDIPLRAWSAIKRPYKELMQLLMQSPCDVLILGRQKNLFETGDDGKMTNAGVGMRSEGESQYEPDVCLRFEMEGRRGESEGIVTMFAEKDRYGILSGRTFARPNFETLAPLLPYLGTIAPRTQTDEEAGEMDSELLVDAVDKAKAKEETSGRIMQEMQVKLLAATNIEEIGAVAAEIKKLKRKMIESHVDALRVLHESRSSELVKALGGAV